MINFITAKIIATRPDKKCRGAQINKHGFIKNMTNCGAFVKKWILGHVRERSRFGFVFELF